MTTWHQPVRVATVVAKTLASDFENGDHIDGVQLATNDRVLIKNQADAKENGIYKVNASGAPTRTTDADTGAELVDAGVLVLEGANYIGTYWAVTNLAITLGSTSIVVAQVTPEPNPRHAHFDQHRGLVPANQLGHNSGQLDAFDQIGDSGVGLVLREYGDGDANWAQLPLNAVLGWGANAGTQIHLVTDPSADQDAATKKYVDDSIAGVADITLGEVLLNGNGTGPLAGLTDGVTMQAPQVGDAHGANAQLTDGAGVAGGVANLRGGDVDDVGTGGYAAIQGGNSFAAGDRARVLAQGVPDDDTNGKVEIYTDATDGVSGQVLVSDGSWATWQDIDGGGP